MFDEYGFINRFDKVMIFTIYEQMVDDSKDYEKITRKKMLFSIYEALIEDPSRFDGYVSANALNLLIDLAHEKQELNFDDFEEYKLVQELQDSFLLIFHGMPEGFKVPSMLSSVIKTIQISDRHKVLDQIYDFLKGILLVRGQVSMKELKIIYDECKPSSISISLNEALHNLPRIYLHIDMAAFVHENAFSHPMFHDDLIFFDYKPVYKHTWETYISFGKYGINIYNAIMNEFYEKLKKNKDKILFEYFVEELVVFTQLSLDFDMSRIMQTFIEIESDIDRGVKLYNDVIKEIPRWKYKGDPISLADMEQIHDIEDLLDNDNELFDDFDCPCGSGLLIEDCCNNEEVLLKNRAALSEDRVHLFYGLFYVLLHRTNQKYRLHPHFSNAERFFERLQQPDFIKLADKFFDSPDIIKDYIKQYEGQITSEQLEILTGFQYSIKKKFVALRYVHQKLVLLDEEEKRLFYVSGITNGISLNIPNNDLPQFVETRLIPMNHEITYAVFISQMPVVIGVNIRKELKKIEKQSKVIRNIEELIETM